MPPSELDGLIFEIQIKTFLQHAWGIATHDLSYKTDDVRWGKDRIVAHLKATIEHAELSIQQADALSRSPSLELDHRRTSEIAAVIAVLKAHWSRDDLPDNLRSLAETIHSLLNESRLRPEDLDELLSAHKGAIGILPINLSPYGVVLQILITQHKTKMKNFLAREKRLRVLVTPELTVPVDIPLTYSDRIVSVQ